eukprot:2545490-Amphidinium_carterae.1
MSCHLLEVAPIQPHFAQAVLPPNARAVGLEEEMSLLQSTTGWYKCNQSCNQSRNIYIPN